MNEDVTLIYSNQVNQEDVSTILERINVKNHQFYLLIVDVMRNQNKNGVRKDVLEYLSSNVEDLMKDKEYYYHLSTLILENKLSPEWYEWINNLLINSLVDNEKISLSDLMIAIHEMIEKNMSLEFAKRVFSENDNILQILDIILNSEGEEFEENDKSEQEAEMELSQDQEEVSNDIVESEKKPVQKMDVFEDLIKAMSIKGRGKTCSVLDVQDGFNKLVAQFQVALTELSSYSTEIIREWEKDKDEIERMSSLYSVYQKMIGSQQQRIMEQANEITRLKADIKEFEQKLSNNQAIIDRLYEIQSAAKDFR